MLAERNSMATYGELLHRLHEDTNPGTAAVGVTLEDRSLEAVGPASNVRRLRDDSLLVLMVCNNFCELLADVQRVDRLTTDSGQSSCGLFQSSLLDEKSWRVREKSQSSPQDQGPKKLNCDRDSVRSSIVPILCSVHYTVGEQNSDRDAELVRRYESATDFLWADLGHVENHNRGDETYTQSTDEPSGNHET